MNAHSQGKGRTLVENGKCTLVGAGPGDPELLTLKAVKAIQAATVLLVDDLVNPEIVALAPRTARVVHVGKRGGCKSTPQAFIERLMVMKTCCSRTGASQGLAYCRSPATGNRAMPSGSTSRLT